MTAEQVRRIRVGRLEQGRSFWLWQTSACCISIEMQSRRTCNPCMSSSETILITRVWTRAMLHEHLTSLQCGCLSLCPSLFSTGRLSALPLGALYSSNKPGVGIPSGPWGQRFTINAPRSSQEGGTESPYHHWRDALQLAAHELGARPASDKPPGVQVVTYAGKEYFRAVLLPFQRNQHLGGLDQARARAQIKAAIKARMREIHEQLMRYPQVPFTARHCTE
jgi:hypothetical protein